MPKLDDKLKGVAEKVLKCSLSDEEELELYRISDAMGMSNIQSFLYLLLVFKLHEDTMRGQLENLAMLKNELKEKFGEMDAMSERINEKLECALTRILGEGAKRIGTDMVEAIAEGARETLTAKGEYHALRGQLILIACLTMIMSAFYRLGAGNVFGMGETRSAISTILHLPAGWCLFIACAMYAYCWAADNWKLVKKSLFYKAALAGISLLALVILITMLLNP
jgi:hypothetical protein